ncbi:MAG TPA: glycosyltransferase family 1 protein, partial [Patescibacteria group bacterium]|nr:glycosyltransferase family 1 protein [Patescibacteria group bacterium]
MKTVCVDARLFRISGIGTYLKNLLGVLQDAPLRWLVLVHKEQLASFKWKEGLEPIVIGSPVYSAREQVELFLK